MSLELASLKTLRIAVEPAGSYGTEIALGSDYLYLPITEDFAMPAPEREMMDPMVAQSLINSTSLKVPGKRSGSAKVDLILGSHGLDVDGDVTVPAITAWPLRMLLQTILGGFSTATSHGAQVTVQALSTTTVVNVTTGAGARMTKGQALGITTANGLEWAEILSISTDAVSLRQALSATPTTGQPVRHSATFYPTQNPDTSLQLAMAGAEVDDRFRFSGAQCAGLALDCKPGMLPKLSVDLKGRGVRSIAAHSGLAEITHSYYSPIIASGGCITVPAFGVTTRVDPLVADASFAFDHKFEPVTSYCATDNIARMRLQRPAGGKAAKITLTFPYESTAWIDARDAKSLFSVFFQLGSEVGASGLLSFPRMQVVSVKRGSSGTNLAGQTVELEALQDTLDATTDLGRASWRLHLG
jgi:hypothetical protein